MKRIILLTILAGALFSCRPGTLTSQYETLPMSGWQADSSLVFTFCVTDSLMHYDMVFSVRHTDDYAYQNIWFFAELYKDSVCLSSDTLEYYLANQRGQWLGNGFGRLREMPMLYKQNVRFAQTGEYHVKVTQGMREDALKGINDFGLIIEKTE